MTLDKLNENDIVIEVDGFRVCVNKNMDYIEKFTIDYSVNPLAKAFRCTWTNFALELRLRLANFIHQENEH